MGRRKEGERRRPVWDSVHGRVEGRRPGGLHRKAILECHEEDVRRRPVRGSAHVRVEGWPGGGASSGSCRVANDSCGGLGASGARGSACWGANGGGSVQGLGDARVRANRGARVGCEEEKASRRVASDDARGNTYGGTNSGCNG
jgi:hypothetical protein